jgi:Fic family protein
MRSYEESHPWISFKPVDLARLGHAAWMLLGEAESKCEHLAGSPLRPDTAKRLYDVYLSKGVHGTASIEGNTLSEADVLAHVGGELRVPPSQEYLLREIDNIYNALNLIVGEVVDGKQVGLTPERMAQFNRTILAGLPLGEDVVPGVLRTHSVVVGRYRGAPPEDCEHLLKELCRWLDAAFACDEQRADLRFTYGLLKAVIAHLYIAWIHPFGDGNGRTARMIEFQILIQAGVPAPAAHLLSNHYNKTRDQYYLELDRTSKGDYRVEGFILYALRGFVDGLREQIDYIRVQQKLVTWENYVHDVFRDQDTPPANRQKHIALDLSPTLPVPSNKIPELSPRVARAYAGKQQKTVTRDINALLELELIRRVRGGYIANQNLTIKAFLPPRAEDTY